MGMTEDAELDAIGSLVWGEGLSIVSANGSSDHGQTLTGRVKDIEGDSVTVRVATGLLLLHVAGDPPIGAVGELVSVTPESFELWPTNL